MRKENCDKHPPALNASYQEKKQNQLNTLTNIQYYSICDLDRP